LHRAGAGIPAKAQGEEDKMKSNLVFSIAALTLGLMGSGAGHAQAENPPTPTTRILAIGTIPADVDPAKVRAILPKEARETVDLYLAGKIDQWYSLQGRKGVAFILNVTDTAAAREMLEGLPLGQAHLMSFELIPLAPLNPLRQLQGMKATSP
jgi:Muconolactone delta-isomerase